MRRSRAALAVLLAIVLPLLVWGLLSLGKNRYKRLPIYGPQEVRASGDTVWHRLPDNFFLLNQDSAIFTAESLRGYVHVANYFFTRCPGICPRLSTAMQLVQARLSGKARRVRLVSYTVDPSYDTPAILREYARRYEADLRRWTFVTGPESTLYHLAVKGYLLPVDKSPDTTQGELGYVHSDMLVLVDPELRVRGFYSGLDSLQVERLLDDINLLLLEYEAVQ